MGLILDLAVVAIAVVVVGSLALLTWTLGVSAVRSVGRGRQRVAASRRRVDEAESRLTAAAARTTTTLEHLNRRTRTAPRQTVRPTQTPGELPDA